MGFYYNAAEVETAMANMATTYAGLASLVDRLNASVGQKPVHALHLHANPGVRKDTIVFIGGVHGNEEGSSDILLEFASGLLSAYEAGKGIQFGDARGRTFHANEIKSILDDHDIVILPLVNPDGHIVSQTTTTGGGRLNARGVDLNRNFDVMYAENELHQDALVSVGLNPGQDLYRGDGPFSEPESANVKNLLDRFPDTRWFIDLHSSGPNIQYGWGCDEVQHDDPVMTFANPDNVGQQKWGLLGDGVSEHTEEDDLRCMKAMAEGFVADVKAVFGTQYEPKRAFTTTVLPGTSYDYAYGRHKMNAASRKILSFLIEWGFAIRPQYDPHMPKIIEEVSAGLTGFCLMCR